MSGSEKETIQCQSANGCSNRVPADKKPFEDSGRILCLPCTVVSYQ